MAEGTMGEVERRDEHRWLERFVGEWTYEMEASEKPGEPPAMMDRGTESARSLQGVWIVCEARSETAEGGGSATSIMTLGFDPAKEKVVGTFIGSMMPYLWIYEGSLDGDLLTLYSEGPSFTTEGAMAMYRDTIELRGDDHRVMTSSFQGEDGTWTQFMTAHYRRAG